MRSIRFLFFAGLLAGPLSVTAGQAGPGVEERPAVTAARAAADAPDISIAVFEQLQQFQSQVEALTGRIEQLEHALTQAREQEKARYLDTDARLKQLEQAKPAAAVPAATAEPPAATPAATAGSDEKTLFEQARALVREKKYDAAIDAFGEQLKQFPRGELVPSAMYWLGEMWLVASAPDAPKAGRYFYRVYNEFPKSSWAGTAMYRHGLLQCQGEEASKGRVTLSKVLIQYPGSQDAKLADAALKQCR
ncbi:MAG: YbgF trimerization domain-containing protein [Pseudomonadota bacterium]